jgi:hypothetical protein
MLSLQEISDRLEIQQLITDYANAIDSRNFDALDRVFTPDAYVDYRALGGVDGRYPAIKAWLAQVLPNFPRYTHLVGNIGIELDRRQRTRADGLHQPDGSAIAGRRQPGDVARALVRGPLRAYARGLADERARRRSRSAVQRA